MGKIYGYSAIQGLLQKYEDSGREWVGYTIPGARIVEMIDAADYNDESAYEKICKAFYSA